ncbi:MAG: zinc ribbon domain-containing protein [Deltaproteobacteria bacterium]|nr:zinc ribbon domain-containing protein [Deltaproteobacteria bacterium]MBW1953748.1 zinc ribbon domain-containing protein [Deltaproteobacteria bacterium]MBW1987498.1 zinc ribbon domain-containing protein [Deltaproteobacteria bacterium]MBW2135617.1 zinc ribbon domain-containing protein [Deltaproteobacteria bacterium]
MPTYEFKCEKCGAEFTLIMSMSERESTKVKCPQCESEDVKQQLSHFMAKTSRKS